MSLPKTVWIYQCIKPHWQFLIWHDSNNNDNRQTGHGEALVILETNLIWQSGPLVYTYITDDG